MLLREWLELVLRCMNADGLKLFERLKLWTNLPQLFVAKVLIFNVLRFIYDLFLEISVPSKVKSMFDLLLISLIVI